MLRLLRQKLDALADPLDPGFGFDLIRLEALLAEETKPVTISFDADENARRQIAFLVDRLAARFGEHGCSVSCRRTPISPKPPAWPCRRRTAISTRKTGL